MALYSLLTYYVYSLWQGRDTISAAPQDEEGRDRDILLGEADESQEQLANLLLWYLSEEARGERLAMMSAVGRALGFQTSNVANQVEHYLLLLLLTTTDYYLLLTTYY